MTRLRRVPISHLTCVLVAACSYPVLLALEGASGWKPLPARALTTMLFGLALLAWIVALYPWHSGLSLAAGSLVLAAARLKWPEVQVFLTKYMAPGWKAAWTLLAGTPGSLQPGEALWARALVVALVAFCLSWSVQRTPGPFLVVSACTCWLLYLWFNYVDAAVNWMVMLFVALVPLLAVWRAAALRSHSGGHRGPAEGGIAAPVLATGMGVLALVTALVLPRDVPPFQMDALARRVEQAFPVVAEWRGGGAGSRYALGEAGFGTSVKDLGGPVRRRTDLVVEAEVSPDEGRKLYLRSEVWATYTGRGWENKYRRLKISSREVVDVASLLPREATRAYPERDASNLTVLSVIPSFEQDSVFVLTEPLEIRQQARDVWGDQGGSLWLSAKSQQGYSVISVEPRPPAPGSSQAGLEWAAFTAVPAVPYAYLYVPGSVPQRVRETTLRVVAGAKGPWEAATMLERFVRECSYVEDAPRAPRGRDFVDYFLFDLRQGYCAYHSTALAVMCRIAGLPSRWVTGYLSPEGAGVRKVRQQHAHAWVEVYIHGSGWVILEGTPAYDVPDRERQAAVTPSTEPSAGPARPGTMPPGTGFEEPEPDLAAGRGGGRAGQATSPLALALGAVFIIVLGRTGWTGLGWRRRYSGSATASSLFATGLRLLSAVGLGKSRYETAREYVARLQNQAPDAGSALSSLVCPFEKECYGGLRVAIEDGDKISIWARLTQAALGKVGKVRYLSRVYIWPGLRA